MPLVKEAQKYKNADKFLNALWTQLNIDKVKWAGNITLDMFYDLYVPKDKDGFPLGNGWFSEVKRFYQEANK